MSIEISSDDGASSCGELPEIDFAGAINKASKALRTTAPHVGVDRNEENLQDSMDLTQEDDQALTDEYGYKPGEYAGNDAQQRPPSSSSDTIEYIDHDNMFDQIYQKESQPDSGISSFRSTDTGVSSIRSTDSGVSSVRSTDSGVSSVRSTNSGVSSIRSDSGVGSGDCGSMEPVSSGSGGRPGVVGRTKRKSAGSLEQPPKKTITALERASKKQKIAEERAAKLAAAEANKIYKPAECMKYMVIQPHPALHGAWYLSALAGEAAAAGAAVAAAPGCEGVLRWARKTPPRLTGISGQVELTLPTEPCDRALLIYTAEETEPYVLSHTLSSHVAQIRDIIDCKLTFVVFGAKDYFKRSGRKKKTNDRRMTEIELEMAFTDLIVSADCDSEVADTSSELALLIMHFTKAIAEAPHKKAKRAYDEQAEFYMRGDNKKCVSIDKDGHGLSRLWQQMIAVLPMSSLETSRAVCANYKSPLALYEEMQDPNSLKDLADIGVDRAGVPGARSRRLGPEFARKLRTLFTAEDGDTLFD